MRWANQRCLDLKVKPNGIGFYLLITMWHNCRISSLGFVTKAKACEGAGQMWRLGITLHALGIVGECEGMNPHTPKWVLKKSQILRERLQGSQPIGSKSSLYHWKALGTYLCKMGLHDPFRHFKHKLWPKEGSEIKLTIWFMTIQS
jgi:hypothetical protein